MLHHTTQSSPMSLCCRQDSLEKIARSFLGFDAIIQKEGLAPSDAEVGAATSTYLVWLLLVLYGGCISVSSLMVNIPATSLHMYLFCHACTQVTEEYEKGAQSFKDAGQDFDAERLREQATETVKVDA